MSRGIEEGVQKIKGEVSAYILKSLIPQLSNNLKIK
jgi:hypothetical protein